MSWRISKPWKHQHTSGGGGSSAPAAPAKPPVPLFSNWITENGWQNLVFDPESNRKTDAYKDTPRLRVYGDIYWVYPGTFSVDQIVFMEQMYPGYFHRSRRAESGFILKVLGRLDNAENIVLKRAAFGAGMLEHIYHSQWQNGGFTYYFYRVREPVTYRDSSLNTSSSLDRTELVTNGRTIVLKTPGTKFYGYNQMPNDEYRRVMDRYQRRLAGADNGRWVNDHAHVQGLVAVRPVPEVTSEDLTTKWFIPKKNNPKPNPPGTIGLDGVKAITFIQHKGSFRRGGSWGWKESRASGFVITTDRHIANVENSSLIMSDNFGIKNSKQSFKKTLRGADGLWHTYYTLGFMENYGSTIAGMDDFSVVFEISGRRIGLLMTGDRFIGYNNAPQDQYTQDMKNIVESFASNVPNSDNIVGIKVTHVETSEGEFVNIYE